MTSEENKLTQEEKKNSFLKDDDWSPALANTDSYYRINFDEGNVMQYSICTQTANMHIATFITAEPAILLYLNVTGASVLTYNDLAVRFSSNEQNIIYVAAGEFTVTHKAQTLINIFALNANIFSRYFFTTQQLLPIVNKYNNLQHFKNNLLLDQKTTLVATEILNCNFDQHFKNLYVKAKAIELITLQLVQKANKQNASELSSLALKKMHLVKQIIDTNLSQAFTINSLAREVGTNEQYLKKYFKLAFNKTIFGYVTEVRMTYAKNLLSNTDMKVVEVATQVGYMHATHFTKAFKKFFGLLPQKLKNNKLLVLIACINQDLCCLEFLYA